MCFSFPLYLHLAFTLTFFLSQLWLNILASLPPFFHFQLTASLERWAKKKIGNSVYFTTVHWMPHLCSLTEKLIMRIHCTNRHVFSSQISTNLAGMVNVWHYCCTAVQKGPLANWYRTRFTGPTVPHMHLKSSFLFITTSESFYSWSKSWSFPIKCILLFLTKCIWWDAKDFLKPTLQSWLKA